MYLEQSSTTARRGHGDARRSRDLEHRLDVAGVAGQDHADRLDLVDACVGAVERPRNRVEADFSPNAPTEIVREIVRDDGLRHGKRTPAGRRLQAVAAARLPAPVDLPCAHADTCVGQRYVRQDCLRVHVVDPVRRGTNAARHAYPPGGSAFSDASCSSCSRHTGTVFARRTAPSAFSDRGRIPVWSVWYVPTALLLCCSSSPPTRTPRSCAPCASERSYPTRRNGSTRRTASVGWR